MKNKSLESFYYDLLHINRNSNTRKKIEDIIIKFKEYIKNNELETDRMCKVLSNLLHDDLKQEGIKNQIVNTHKLFGGYEHEFVITSYRENEQIEYLLIDLTYSQFLRKDNTTSLKYPSEYLEGNHVLQDLLENGYSVVNNQDFQQYLYGFHQNDYYLDFIRLEDILYKEVPTK